MIVLLEGRRLTVHLRTAHAANSPVIKPTLGSFTKTTPARYRARYQINQSVIFICHKNRYHCQSHVNQVTKYCMVAYSPDFIFSKIENATYGLRFETRVETLCIANATGMLPSVKILTLE